MDLRRLKRVSKGVKIVEGRAGQIKKSLRKMKRFDGRVRKSVTLIQETISRIRQRRDRVSLPKISTRSKNGLRVQTNHIFINLKISKSPNNNNSSSSISNTTPKMLIADVIV